MMLSVRPGMAGAVVCLLLSTGLWACGGEDNNSVTKGGQETEASTVVSLGEAPDFVIQTLSGERFRLEQQLGRVVVVNFWATWCAPCREEIPDFVRLQDELRERGLRFVGISVDDEDGADQLVADFAAEYEINYPIALDDGTVAADYRGNLVVPSTFLIDRVGRIRHRFIGAVSFDTMIPKLEELLSENVDPPSLG